MHKSTITRIQSEMFPEEPAYLNFIFEIMYLESLEILEYNQYPIYYLAPVGIPKKGRFYWQNILEAKASGRLFSAFLFYQQPHVNV